MKETIIEFESSEIYPLSEIINKLDFSINNPNEMLNKAFQIVQSEKIEKYINKVINTLKIKKYEVKIVKVLPNYIKEGIDKINFKVIFQIKFNKSKKLNLNNLKNIKVRKIV